MMVYRLKYLDSYTSHSLLIYGSYKTRIGVSPFDTACCMVQMRMCNLMCVKHAQMCSFNVSGPFEQQENDGIWGRGQ